MKNFRRNPRGMAQLLRSPAVQAEIRRRAERVRQQADTNAPVGETGRLAQSHEVDSTPAKDRARARVYSTTDYAVTVEANTGYLSRALDAAGVDE